ncbi:MAG: amidohydrolase family protein [Terriglobales bacterium]
MRALLLSLILGFAALSAAQTKPAPSQLTIEHANVVDTRHGTVLRNQTVVVQNGVIQALSPDGVLADKGTVIDATGKYLIPGLWDMHVHSALTPVWDERVIYSLYIANGVTGIRDMGGDPGLLEQRRGRIVRGELLGPHMIMAGPFLAGGKSNSETIAINTPEEARQAVDTLKQRGVDFVKILTNIPRDSYFAVAEESAKQNLHFVGHVPTAVSVAEASAAGQHSIEHLTGVSLACSSKENTIRQQMLEARTKRDYAALIPLGQQVLDTYDGDKAQRLFALLKKNATWQVPTLVWTQANSTVDEAEKLHADSRLQYVPAKIKSAWDPKKTLQQTSAEELKLAKAELVRDVELVKSMHTDGVSFMAGSDGPDPFVFPGFSLHDELEWLVKAGFTPAEALQAATLEPATFMDKLDRYGVVEPGHEADMVLLEANPLEEIRNTRRISAVILGGKYYGRAELDRILAQVQDLAKTQ